MSKDSAVLRTKFDELLLLPTGPAKADLQALANDVIDRVETLENSLEDCQVECSGLKDEVEGNRGEIADAVNRFCDEVERPVGSMKYTVPDNDRVNRAIIGLHDAIGRNI